MSDNERSHRLYSGHEGSTWAYIDYDIVTKRAVRLRMLNQSPQPFHVKLYVDEAVVAEFNLLPHTKPTRERRQVRRMTDGTPYTVTTQEANPALEVSQALDFPVAIGPGGITGFEAVVEHG